MATNSTNSNQEEKYIEIGRLATGLFHDLINPLSAILLNLEEVVNNKKLEKQIKDKYCQEALKAGYCLNQFISDVNCQIRQNNSAEIFNLKQLINSCHTLFNYQLVKFNIHFIIEVSGQINIHGLKNSLCRIINNLLSNAIRACQKANKQNNSSIIIKAVMNKDYLEIKLIDNGIGVALNMENKLFDEFSSTKNKKDGLCGFGLYSAQKMLKKDFKGKIVYQRNKVGSTFIVKIPKGACEKLKKNIQ